MKDCLKLRILRHAAGLNQHQIAETLQIPVAQYSRIESGLEKPSREVEEEILKIYSMSSEQLTIYEPQIDL